MTSRSTQPLSYTGPSELPLKTPVTLFGTYDPAQVQAVTVMAEDKYPFEVQLEAPQGRWMVTLSEGFYQAGARWLRLQGRDGAGKVIANQIVPLTIVAGSLNTSQDLMLMVRQDTLFKLQSKDSSALAASQTLVVKAQTRLKVVRYDYREDHLLVQLEAPLGGLGNLGFFYEDHVTLSLGKMPLVFDSEQLQPQIQGAAQLLITQATLFKAQPIDGGNLATAQKAPLLPGQSFDVSGYTAFKNHFRVTLTQALGGVGKTGFIYVDHMRLQKNGRSIAYDPQSLRVTMLQGTIIKRRPVNSSNLAAADRYNLPKGQTYGLLSYAPDDDHVRVTLTENLPGFGNTGYLYPPYVKFQRGGQVIDPLPNSIELNVPYLSQLNNRFRPRATCNVTSLAMAMRYWGTIGSTSGQLEDELYQWCVKNYGPESQTDNTVLVKLMRAYGFTADFRTDRTWAEIRTELRLGRPVVVGGFFTAAGHIVCVIGFNSQGYWVNDPYGDALTGYRSAYGGRRFYPRNYMEKMCSPEGDGHTWAHFFQPNKTSA
jgi:Peptidase_C39 like family